jgi:hypothetical protein
VNHPWLAPSPRVMVLCTFFHGFGNNNNKEKKKKLVAQKKEFDGKE